MGLVSDWKERGHISGAEAEKLEPIESGRLFSLHAELRAMLYGGALLLVAGVSATVKAHFAQLGEAAIVGALLLGIAACATYCFPRTPAFSRAKVESPTALYDYAVYVGCALLGILLAFIESRHKLLGARWDWYLLLASFVFFPLAYRCDNRLVLSLALLDIAGWWMTGAGLFRSESLFALRLGGFGVLVGAVGRSVAAAGLKPHFEDAYLTVAVHAFCVALVPGALDGLGSWQWFVLGAAASAVAWCGMESRRFSFFLYGCSYSYLALTIAVFKHLKPGILGGSNYFLLSAGAAAFMIVSLRGRFQETR